MLALLDTPLNKAGKLRIFVVTKKGVLIKVSPDIRFPRTYKRFSGLITELLTNMKIKSDGDGPPLLEILNGQVETHLPENAYKVGTST